MNASLVRIVKPRVAQRWGTVLTQASGVCVAGLLAAVAANFISPRGLELSRDYFPDLPPQSTGNEIAASAATIAATASVGQGPDTEVSAAVNVPQAGQQFQVASVGRVLELLESPAYQQERVIFVDARSEDSYTAGHIPGAYAFDRFYPERFLPDLLPAAMAAEKVIVYCIGGDCEDSEYAALTLLEAGVAGDRIWVYSGGMEEWRARNGTVELGERLSGDLQPTIQ